MSAIDGYKKRAKVLFAAIKTGNAEAISRYAKVLRDTSQVSLMRVQHVIAVECGYRSWQSLLDAPEREARERLQKVPS